MNESIGGFEHLMRFNWIITGALLLLACAQAWAADGPYYINATEVNLREAPNGDVLLVFDLNEKVFVVERDGDWSFVSAPRIEQKGWVWGEYCGDIRVAAPKAEEIAWTPKPAAAQSPSAPTPTRPALVTDVVIEQGGTLVPGNAAPQPAPDSAPVVASSPAPAPEAAAPASHQVASASPAAVQQPDATEAAHIKVTGGGFIPDAVADSAPPEQPAVVVAQRQPDPAPVVEVLSDPGPEPVPFYQSFEREVDVTIPAALGGGYLSVGGNDIALITGTNVNIREAGSTSSRVLGKVDSGDKGYVVSSQDSWYLLSIPEKNIQGWVHGDFVNQLPRVEITGDSVRLRESPSLSARIKTEVNNGDVFQKFEQQDGWVLVASSASGLKGWVHADYVKKTERLASRPYTVAGDDVNFRASPAVDAEIITALGRGTKVEVLGRNERWSFIAYSGQQGWMYSQYLDPDFKHAPQQVYGKSIGGRLIQRAQEMSGTPYVWGGESDSGVDCSGLIYKLLLDEGADASCLPRRASTQMAGLGQAVDKEALEPGDLVFFTTYKPGPSHVGIYLGDGDFIHASSAQSKVTISNMSEGYYRERFVGARRITETELQQLK